MGTAYKCELTGALNEGAGKMVVDVPLSEDLKAQVRIFGKINKDTFLNQPVSPDGEAMILNALSVLSGKLQKEKKK